MCLGDVEVVFRKLSWGKVYPVWYLIIIPREEIRFQVT